MYNHFFIVVDNRSKNESESILNDKYHENSKVDFIVSDINGGYSYGNNYGAKYALNKYNSEYIIVANPDVILANSPGTNEAGLTAVEDIVSREGWDTITAIQNGDVYQIDKNSSSRGSQNIIKALKEMAKAVYPDEYKDF